MFTRIIGIIQLLLLCALFGLPSGTRAGWAIAICFCSITLLTSGYFATRRLQYDGWTGWLLCSSSFYILPIAALLYLAVPRTNFALFAVCACAVIAEQFREKRAEQAQLGWIAPPIVSAAFAIWLNLALLEQVVNFVMAAAAVCATAVYYAKVSRPPMRYVGGAEVMVRPQPTARAAARSVGRAA
jgi:hypothetical protein